MSPPPDRDNLDRLLKSFLENEPAEKEKFKLYLSGRFNTILSELGDVKANQERNYLEHKADFRGLAARIDKHDQLLDSILDGKPAQTGYRTAPGAKLVTPGPRRMSPMPGPISIPPARVELDTGSFNDMTKESAKVMIAKEAERIAREAIVEHDNEEIVANWRGIRAFLIKAAGVVFAGLVLVVAASYGVGQCGKAHAASIAPTPMK